MRTRFCLAVVFSLFLAMLGRSSGLAQQSPAVQQPQQPGARRGNGGSQEFSASDIARVYRGFQIAPVPLNLEGKDCRLVGLGSYIVNAQGSSMTAILLRLTPRAATRSPGSPKGQYCEILGGRDTIWRSDESGHTHLAQSDAGRHHRLARGPDLGSSS